MESILSYSQLRLAIWLTLFGLMISFIGGGRTAVFANPSTSDIHLANTQQQTSLEELLNDDGSLNLSTGFNGSLDPTGWQLTLEDNGEPRFEPAGNVIQDERPAASDPSLWDERFHPPGLSIGGCEFGAYCIASANAIVVIGTDVYVGGDFTHAGPDKINFIAKWDGNSWSDLGEGVNGVVRTIAVDGNDLYVGGNFTQAGGVAANYIAKWNGSSWTPLGSGLNDQVYTLEIAGDKLYAGGNFTEAGENPANRIAEWNGTTWTALGEGTNDTVRDIAIIDDNLYVGGYFTTAGTETINYIARWDGVDWQAVGAGGPSEPVWALAVSEDNLYAAVNDFFNNMAFVSVWNGASWSTLGNSAEGEIFALLTEGTDVYAAGNFIIQDGQPINNFARWNGTNWTSIGNVGPQPQAIAYADGDIYLGGFMMYGMNNNNENWVAGITKWDGTNWLPLDNGTARGLHAEAKAIAIDANNIYVGGAFTRAGSTVVDKISEWDGSNWQAMGDGIEDLYIYTAGRIETIAIFDRDVYVGGDFTSIGGISANGLAKWDGDQWSDLNGGVLYAGSSGNGMVHDLVVNGNELYVAGYFTSIAGVSANAVAKWDGNQWEGLGSDVSSGGAHALLIDGEDIYMGGNILLNGSSNYIYIVQLVGNSWQEVGDGFNDFVYALEMHNGELIAGGRFTMSGTTPVNRLARWDGQEWHPLGNGLGSSSNENERVLDLESHGELYAGGYFTTTGSEPSAGLATWDGMQWESFSADVEQSPGPLAVMVHDIEFQGNTMYIAGNFTEAGGQPAFNFAKWGFNEELYLPLITRP